MTLKSSKVWVIYQINTVEHSVNVLIFSHPGEFKRDLSEF